jgi:hypothetical protein
MLSKTCRAPIGTVLMVAIAAFNTAGSAVSPAPQERLAPTKSLDYEFFKANVEPIFLKKRPGHARCYACHGSGTGPQYLVPLSPGSTSWTEDQSRQIFRNVSRLVDRDEPMNSVFLIHPLSPMAAGDLNFVHSGGRQFESKEDPDWQIMAKWVTGAKLTSSTQP